NGELPGGFLPIRKSGVTHKLYVSAQSVAAAVAAQKAPNSPSGHHHSGPPSTGPQQSPSGTSDLPSDAPTDAAPSTAPSSKPSQLPPSDTAAAPMPPTSAIQSRVSKGLIPALLLLGLLGLGVSAASRFFVRPPRGTR